MLIVWLVLTGRWDVFGSTQEDMPVGKFLSSAALAAMEGAAELIWLVEIL